MEGRACHFASPAAKRKNEMRARVRTRVRVRVWASVSARVKCVAGEHG